MTLKELQSGTKFKYGHTSYYSLETLTTGGLVVCQFGQYLANIEKMTEKYVYAFTYVCLLYTSPSPRDRTRSRMPSSA